MKKEIRNTKNLVIISHGAYPYGMAPTQRMHLYAKSIVQLGCEVKIILPNPPRKIFNNKLAEGEYQGVHFKYTCGTSIRPKSYLKRRFLFTWGQISLLFYLIGNRRKIDAVIVTTVPYFSILIIYSLLLAILGIPSIREINEYRFFRNHAKDMVAKIYQSFNRYLSPKLFNGFLVISDNLKEYYEARISKKKRLILIPILVDMDEFDKHQNIAKNKTIVCSGSLSELKDGTLTLIKAFNKVNETFKDYNLILTGGNPASDDFKLAKQFVKQLNLQEKVVFTGFLSREELIRKQVEASLLVLAKPESVHADYCFPTKLGEYLSTKNPVLVTNTGEISRHLTDGSNAFIVPPNSFEKLAEKLEWILTHRKEAEIIGMNGYEVAKHTFNYKIYGKVILEFISEL